MRQGSIIQLGMDDPAGPAELRILGDRHVVVPAPSGTSAVAAENASAANSAANEACLLSVADWTRGRLFAEGQGRLTRS